MVAENPEHFFSVTWEFHGISMFIFRCQYIQYRFFPGHLLVLGRVRLFSIYAQAAEHQDHYKRCENWKKNANRLLPCSVLGAHLIWQASLRAREPMFSSEDLEKTSISDLKALEN